MDTQKRNATVSGQSRENVSHTTDRQTLPTAPNYEAPYIVSYTDQDILEELGPALTGGGSRSNLF